jgi:hypothetical protein
MNPRSGPHAEFVISADANKFALDAVLLQNISYRQAPPLRLLR